MNFTDEDREFLDDLLSRARAYGRRRRRLRAAKGVAIAGSIILYALTRR